MKKKPKKTSDVDIFARIMKDRVLRRQMAYRSHEMFFTMYFADYLKYKTAQFQRDIIHLTEDDGQELVCIAGFRGSAKSTIGTLSFPLWAILGTQQKKFVLIIAQTQSKAREHMNNIKDALENNALLKSDMGPFKEISGGGEWSVSSLVFKNTGARISIASVDQSIRGTRHREHRPDVIILDDVEDTSSVRTSEGRKKIADWYSREVVPLGDTGTRIMILANVLHYDSLVMRLKRKIEDNEMDGVYRAYPIVDKRGKPLWPEKFNSPKKIEALRRRIGDDIAWAQEYLLTVISDASQAIHHEWIQYYDQIPPLTDDVSERTFAAVDLAITKKDSGDFTAIVQARVRHEKNGLRIYILPNPINTKMSYPEAIDCMKIVIPTLGEDGLLFMETTGFQEVYYQQLIQDGYYNVESVKPLVDKHTRLTMTGPLVRDAIVLFPKHGCEKLLTQMIGFGVERHDDMSDAFSMLIQQIIEQYSYDTDPGLPKGPRQPGLFRASEWPR